MVESLQVISGGACFCVVCIDICFARDKADFDIMKTKLMSTLLFRNVEEFHFKHYAKLTQIVFVEDVESFEMDGMTLNLKIFEQVKMIKVHLNDFITIVKVNLKKARRH